ncbi:MAG: class I SAM-dependent methyltransferase [Anaerolineales bacterium]|nr:class I SAM-dependent methyltransferase [Anaerolineales bacterium]
MNNNATTLYDELQKYWLEREQQGRISAKRGTLEFGPKFIDGGGGIIFRHLKRDGFATFLVPRVPQWDPYSAYYEEARNASRRGLRITRLFIVPHPHYLRQESLRIHWELDKEAGIDVKSLILAHQPPLLPSTLDFGIWDDEIVCWVLRLPDENKPAPIEWVVSRRIEDLSKYQAVRNDLLNQQTSTMSPIMLDRELSLDEPLLQSAPLMEMLSSYLCNGGSMDRDNCSWYHSAWQYLRLLDLVSTPSWHPNFYINRLVDDVTKGETRRVLITGTADYSVLAYVIEAFNQVDVKCEITVLDLCETPLHICRWYAATKGYNIRTIRADLLEFEEDVHFDKIVTDAFLTRFNDIDKPRILKKWYDLLGENGSIVTTVRLEGKTNQEPIGSSVNQITDFSKRAKDLAEIWYTFVRKPPEYVASLAEEYARHMVSFSVPDAETVKKLFIDAGFRIQLNERVVKGEMKQTIYGEIVAWKS